MRKLLAPLFLMLSQLAGAQAPTAPPAPEQPIFTEEPTPEEITQQQLGNLVDGVQDMKGLLENSVQTQEEIAGRLAQDQAERQALRAQQQVIEANRDSRVERLNHAASRLRTDTIQIYTYTDDIQDSLDAVSETLDEAADNALAFGTTNEAERAARASEYVELAREALDRHDPVSAQQYLGAAWASTQDARNQALSQPQ